MCFSLLLVDNDANFSFRNGTDDFATLNRDGNTLIRERHWKIDEKSIVVEATATGYARSPNSRSRPGLYYRLMSWQPAITS